MRDPVRAVYECVCDAHGFCDYHMAVSPNHKEMEDWETRHRIDCEFCTPRLSAKTVVKVRGRRHTLRWSFLQAIGPVACVALAFSDALHNGVGVGFWYCLMMGALSASFLSE